MFDLRQKGSSSYVERADGQKLYFDAVTRRSENNSAKVSTHPVETGFVISDHVSISNKKLSVEGVISDANNSLLNIAIQNTSDSSAARDFLKELFEVRKVVTLVTPEAEHTNMIITNLTFNRDKATRKELSFSMRLEEIRTVTSSTALVAEEDIDKDVKNAIQNENKDGTANLKTASEDEGTALQKTAASIRKLINL